MDVRQRPFRERRARLESRLASPRPPLFLTPATGDAGVAQDWFERFEGAGLDGVIAKRLDGLYQPGVRAMAKIKHLRSADCVVGGYRWNRGEGRSPGGPSRWNASKDTSRVALRPELVCEVRFDYLQGQRFRHASTFLCRRPDKPPRACTFDQLEAAVPAELAAGFAAG